MSTYVNCLFFFFFLFWGGWTTWSLGDGVQCENGTEKRAGEKNFREKTKIETSVINHFEKSEAMAVVCPGIVATLLLLLLLHYYFFFFSVKRLSSRHEIFKKNKKSTFWSCFIVFVSFSYSLGEEERRRKNS